MPQVITDGDHTTWILSYTEVPRGERPDAAGYLKSFKAPTREEAERLVEAYKNESRLPVYPEALVTRAAWIEYWGACPL